MVFLPTKENQRQFCINTINEEFEKQGLEVIGWREVPTNQMIVGEIAGRTLPHIEQVFVRPNEGKSLNEKELNTNADALLNISSFSLSKAGFEICILLIFQAIWLCLQNI